MVTRLAECGQDGATIHDIGAIIAMLVQVGILQATSNDHPEDFAGLFTIGATSWLGPNRWNGTCQQCGYDRRGSPAGQCPECGTPFSRSGLPISGPEARNNE